MPVEPVTTLFTAALPAGWFGDPMSRHSHRYWDGSAWTADVSDDGRTSQDPIAAAPPAEAATVGFWNVAATSDVSQPTATLGQLTHAGQGKPDEPWRSYLSWAAVTLPALVIGLPFALLTVGPIGVVLLMFVAAIVVPVIVRYRLGLTAASKARAALSLPPDPRARLG